MSSVDIVVPCHRYGRYLRQCVESVLGQSHTDLRVIIIDDASPDETPEVATALAAGDRRVEVRRHAVNLGHIASYNEGIGLARADYMLLLDADDYLLPGAVARAVAVLDAAPDVGLAWGATAGAPRSLDTVARFVDGADFVEALAHGNLVAQSTAFVRTAVQKRLGLYRPELPHAGDLEMWLRFALDGRIAFIPEPQAEHRLHDANMSRGYDFAADLLQCIASFRPHFAAVRRSFPDGAQREARVRAILADRARRQARRALVRGRLPTFAHLAGVWLAQSVASTVAGRRSSGRDQRSFSASDRNASGTERIDSSATDP
jgi:glycosyltransferase involved in cell wall biosynthesis